ncbi:MAG: DUF362 domain-containing protein [Thermoguttaceae bacterium]|nr:DUF362 domain-containing protein [Thermoguttaceae bacterium]
MPKSKVYFTDLHTTLQENLLEKLERLVRKAGMETIDFSNKFVAIKIHFGEPGNLAYLRPNFSKVIVDMVRRQGGKPFMTDCNTLYVGRRKNAVDHLETAYEHGYSPFSTGAHVIIGDGLKGNDDIEVPVHGDYIENAKIGRVIMDADILISITHFKMHEATGSGGVLKNLGMGCGSKSGKMEMHCNGKPDVDRNVCIGCGLCQKNCAHQAIAVKNKKAAINANRCVGCGRCIGVCPSNAINPTYNEAFDVLNRKIVEYAEAVIKDRPCFHLSFIIDVSHYCDCHGENDIPVVPDVGILASFDPVALEQACIDLINRQPIARGSYLEKLERTGDYFNDVYPHTNWKVTIEHAVKRKLGNPDYELIDIH